jgi:hypothetical protein
VALTIITGTIMYILYISSVLYTITSFHDRKVHLGYMPLIFNGFAGLGDS